MMEDVLDRADGVLLEGRQSVRDLRNEASTDAELSGMLKQCGEDLERNHPAIFTFQVSGLRRDLNPIVKSELYRIARDAITNSFLHSGATNIKAELIYELTRLCVKVRDNGKGIDPQVLKNGKAGHWGLAGMRERAQKIGAQLYIRNDHPAGTMVELNVVAKVAFKGNYRRSWRPRFRFSKRK